MDTVAGPASLAIRPQMPTDEELASLSDAELSDALRTWAGRIAAGESRLLAYIGEWDRREAWGGPGMLSCAQWLSWRLGMGRQAAYERVRVARALRTLPATAAAFAAGEVSWTQVRAITRVAQAGEEAVYLELARHAAGTQLERLARGVRRARRLSTDAADPVQAEWRMRTSVRYDEDGTLVLTTRLPAEQGALVLAALEAARAQIDAERRAESSAEESGGESSAEESPDADPANRGAPGTGTTGRDQQAADDAAGDEPEREPERDRPAAATLADAVVRIAQDSLIRRAREHPDRARRDRSRLQVAVDPLSGWARLADGELLPPPVTKTLLPALAGGHDHPGLPGPLRPLRITDLTARDLGRSRREPDLRLRELIGLIDGERCRFPGCTRNRKLHAHHVLFWSMGGRTDLANLVLLCARHHTIVHADGFLLRLRPDRTLEVRQADGTVVEHRPALPWRPAAELDPDARIGAATLLPAAGADRLHLEYAVWVLLNQAA